jgi:tripartite-type tricarboxylate transporter receptor subunit TctC
LPDLRADRVGRISSRAADERRLDHGGGHRCAPQGCQRLLHADRQRPFYLVRHHAIEERQQLPRTARAGHGDHVIYDPLRFVPVALLARVSNALVVRNDLPVGSVSELIAYAKANPGKLTFGSQGAGSTAHLSASQLEVLGGIKMVHVPYRGAVPALNDVIAGHIDMFFDTLTTSVPMYRSRKVKILGVGGAERSPVVPEVPTLAESGLPGFRSVTWFALVAPPATPATLADKINHDVVVALKRGDVTESFARLTLEPMPGSPADATRFFAEETALWGKVIAQAHIRVE